MNSSGISFKNEIRALFVAVLVAILVEIYFQCNSRENKQFYIQLADQFSKVSQTLGEAKDRPSVLVLGNSLAYNGILPADFQKFVKGAQKRDVTVDRAILFGCRVAEWNYILKNYFTQKGRRPDVLLVGFTTDFLLDTAPVYYQYLPDYCSWRNVPEILGKDLGQFEDRVGALFCFVSKTFRYRTKFRHYFLNGCIPYYKNNKSDLIQVARPARATGAPPAGKESVSVPKYERLKRFLKTVKKTRSDLIMVAMPMPSPYKIDPEAIKLITDAGYHWIDGSKLVKIPANEYADSLHMNHEGGVRFTRALVEYLLKNYPREFRPRGAKSLLAFPEFP